MNQYILRPNRIHRPSPCGYQGHCGNSIQTIVPGVSHLSSITTGTPTAAIEIHFRLATRFCSLNQIDAFCV